MLIHVIHLGHSIWIFFFCGRSIFVRRQFDMIREAVYSRTLLFWFRNELSFYHFFRTNWKTIEKELLMRAIMESIWFFFCLSVRSCLLFVDRLTLIRQSNCNISQLAHYKAVRVVSFWVLFLTWIAWKVVNK